MRVEEYETIKCPWCNKEVIARNNRLARHLKSREGFCVGSKQLKSTALDLLSKKLLLVSKQESDNM